MAPPGLGGGQPYAVAGNHNFRSVNRNPGACSDSNRQNRNLQIKTDNGQRKDQLSYSSG
jgi:hypothetical protein